MTDDRNLTTHTYVEEVADGIYVKISDYFELMDAIFSLIKRNIERDVFK